MTAAPPGVRRRFRTCGWCLVAVAVAVAVELALYASYRGHDARFHWFTHFFVGSAAALIVMAAVSARTRRPVRAPLLWPLAAHLYAALPDFLFLGGTAHARWMDVFLGHIGSHFVPGRNVTWYVAFLAALALYLAVLDRARDDVPA